MRRYCINFKDSLIYVKCDKYCIEYFHDDNEAFSFSNYNFLDEKGNIFLILPNDGSVGLIEEIN